MQTFLLNVLEINRSGLIIPETEQLKILGDKLEISWHLKMNNHYKLVYTVGEFTPVAEVCLEDLNNMQRTVSKKLNRNENPCTAIQALLAELGPQTA